MTRNWYTGLAFIAVLLAFVVIVLGAYTRLANAGLSCPDWPTCYGHLTVPESHAVISQLDQQFPARPVQTAKAWKEMIHRYFAGTLGLLIVALAVWSLLTRIRSRHDPHEPVKLAAFLVLLVIVQAALGMWTVTLLLKPVIVMGHLLGGMALASLLWLLALRSGHLLRLGDEWRANWPRWLALAGLIVLIIQIALGGWTSSHYAAYACPDFPTCQGQWWPSMNFSQAFVLWPTGQMTFEGGVLALAARTAIHVTHRLGAFVTLLLLGGAAASFIIKAPCRRLRVLGGVVGFLLLVQMGLGIALVKMGFPVAIAVAHNGNAALLLLSAVTLNAAIWRGRTVESRVAAPTKRAGPVSG